MRELIKKINQEVWRPYDGGVVDNLLLTIGVAFLLYLIGVSI